MTERTAFYPGSFDPVTNGHTDIIARAVTFVDKLVIAVGVHDAKRPMFAAQERISLLGAVIGELGPAAERIEIVTFDDLAIKAAQRAGATLFIRGLRDGTDLDYEAQLAGMNAAMAPDVETVFLPASAAVRHIAANLVRQIALMDGDVSHFVAPVVQSALLAKAATTLKT